MEDALDTDELAGRAMLAEFDHPTLGRVRSVGLPIHVSDFQPTYGAGPRFGEGQEAILAEVGYTPDQVAALRAKGAFGTSPGDGVEAPTAAT
jgi:formyl-CoA transferase